MRLESGRPGFDPRFRHGDFSGLNYTGDLRIVTTIDKTDSRMSKNAAIGDICSRLQKMARRHSQEGGNHLDQESNRQTTMEDTDGGLHPAVCGQSLNEIDEKNWHSSDYSARHLAIEGQHWDW